jgi:hypothetical protein
MSLVTPTHGYDSVSMKKYHTLFSEGNHGPGFFIIGSTHKKTDQKMLKQLGLHKVHITPGGTTHLTTSEETSYPSKAIPSDRVSFSKMSDLVSSQNAP